MTWKMYSWRKSLRGCDHQLTHELDPGDCRLLTTSLSLEDASFPELGGTWRMRAGGSNVLVRPSAWCVRDWTPLRPLHKLLRFCGCEWKIFVLRPPGTSLACKFPCLLNMPPTNQKWSAFSPSLSALCTEFSFKFHPGNSWGCEPTYIYIPNVPNRF